MYPVSITFNFSSPAEAAAWLLAVNAPPSGSIIAHTEDPIASAGAANNPFAQGGAAAPYRPSVPSIADAAASATAAGTSFPPPNVFSAPAVPPVPSAPAPTASAAPSNPAGVDLDSTGLPWDSRIHSKPPSKTKEGPWRQKRGLNDSALKARVEQELRAAMAAAAPTTWPSPSASSPTPSLPLVPPPPIVPPPASSPVANTPATPAPLPATAAPPAPANTPSGESFGQLMARLAPLTIGDPAKAAKINQALSSFNLTALAQLVTRPDLLGPFSQTVDALLAQ